MLFYVCVVSPFLLSVQFSFRRRREEYYCITINIIINIIIIIIISDHNYPSIHPDPGQVSTR